MIITVELLIMSEQDEALAELGIPTRNEEYDMALCMYNLGKDLEYFIKAQEVELNGEMFTGLLLEGMEDMVVINMKFKEFSKLIKTAANN